MNNNEKKIMRSPDTTTVESDHSKDIKHRKNQEPTFQPQMHQPQMDHGQMDHSLVDHAQMDHSQMDHSQMDHSQMDHSQMDHAQMDHSQVDHAQMDHSMKADDGHGGHGNHHEAMIKDFKKRFWVVLILSIPIIILSSMTQMLLGYHLEFPGSKIIIFALSSIVFFYGGFPFLKAAKAEFKARTPGMMMLISLALISAYIYSTLTTFFLTGSEFYFELSTLI